MPKSSWYDLYMKITLKYAFLDAAHPLHATTTIGTPEDAIRLSNESGAWVQGLDAAGETVGHAFEGAWFEAGRDGRGRKPIAGVARNTKVQIGFTPNEHETYIKAAANAGWSLNEWVRRACKKALE